ncbi:MAG: hypothetical protein ACI4SL_01945, partial [Candidatus Ornithospirochaeta sp.]
MAITFKHLKRLLVIVLLFLVVISPLFSQGGKERAEEIVSSSESLYPTTPDASSETLAELILIEPPMDEDLGVIESFIWTISNTLDKITEGLCLSLTPFPQAINLFYEKDFKVTGQNSYDSFSLEDEDVFMSRNTTGVEATAFDSMVRTKTPESQKKTVNMVFVIIGSLFLAEIVLTIVYSYITGGEDPLLKTIMAKFVTAIFIGALIMALPFLMEALKYGFRKAVEILAWDNLGGDIKILGDAIGEVSTFHYPGLYFRLITGQLEHLDLTTAGISFDGTIAGPVQTGIAWLIFMVVKLGIVIIALFTSLHIAFNVIEIYILIPLALILLPWQLFKPLSFIGSGVIKSLISNIIQLTVISFVILSIVPITASVTNSLWQSATEGENIKDAAFIVTTMNEERNANLQSDGILALSFSYSGKTTVLDLSSINLSATYPRSSSSSKTPFTAKEILKNTGLYCSVIYSEDLDGSVICTVTPQFTPLGSVDREAWTDFMAANSETLVKEIQEWIPKKIEEKYPEISKLQGWSRNVSLKTDSFDYSTSFLSLPTAKKIMVAKMALGESGYLNVEEKNKVNDSKGWMRVFSYLATAMVIAYMQTFFIQRSSQIAQGLLDGRDSGPDIASRLSARASATFASGAVRSFSSPLRGVGGLFTGGVRQATSNIGQKVMDSGHSSLGSFLKNTSGV